MSISDVDYNGLVSIISFMSVNSSVSHTRGSYTSYFTSHMSNISLMLSSQSRDFDNFMLSFGALSPFFSITSP